MRILYIVVIMLCSVFIVLTFHFPTIATFGMAALLLALVLVIVVKSLSSPFPLSAYGLKNQVVATSLVMFGIAYLPSFVTECVYFGTPDFNTAMVFFSVLFGTNIPLILDGLLCYFILSFPGGQQQLP